MRLSDRARTRLNDCGLEFLASFLKVEVRRNPENVEALAELGHALTRLGHFEDGLQIDRRLVSLAPDNSTVHYNLACSLALLHRSQDALDALERAAELGYDDAEHLVQDEDLLTLHGDSRFEDLVRKLRVLGSYPV